MILLYSELVAMWSYSRTALVLVAILLVQQSGQVTSRCGVDAALVGLILSIVGHSRQRGVETRLRGAHRAFDIRTIICFDLFKGHDGRLSKLQPV